VVFGLIGEGQSAFGGGDLARRGHGRRYTPETNQTGLGSSRHVVFVTAYLNDTGSSSTTQLVIMGNDRPRVAHRRN
jgi:hypothetical protein